MAGSPPFYKIDKPLANKLKVLSDSTVPSFEIFVIFQIVL